MLFMKQSEKNHKHESLTTQLRQVVTDKSFPDNRFYTVKYIMDNYEISRRAGNGTHYVYWGFYGETDISL